MNERAHECDEVVGFRTEPFCGDTFVTTAFVAGIRRKFPNAKIIARVENSLQREIFSGNPNIDEMSESINREDVGVWFDFYGIPKVWYDEKRYPEQEQIARVRREEIDRMMSGGPVPSREGRAAGMWMAACLFDLLQLGRVKLTCMITDIEATIEDASIYTSEKDQNWAKRLCGRQKVATLYNGTGRKTWSWYVDRWSQVVQYLRSRGFIVYQLGVKSDLAVEGADALLGHTTLGQAPTLIQRACLHVGTDGSMTHFAAAYRVPSVVLFGPNPAGVYGYDNQIKIVSGSCKNCWNAAPRWDMRCARGRDKECMKSITVEQVCDAIDTAIQRFDL